MSDEWWVMEIEWRKLSDGFLLSKQALNSVIFVYIKWLLESNHEYDTGFEFSMNIESNHILLSEKCSTLRFGILMFRNYFCQWVSATKIY